MVRPARVELASPTVAPSRSALSYARTQYTRPAAAVPAAGHCHIQVVKEPSAFPVAMPERRASACARATKLVPHPGFEPGPTRF